MTIRAISLLNNFSTASMASPWLSPEMPREMQNAVVLVMAEQTSGAPATATISPTFQAWCSICGSNQEEVSAAGGGTDPTISWFTLAAAANPSLLPDGDWPATTDVSAAVFATPVGVLKRIDGGFPWRLRIAWALTGGTTPAIKLTAIAYVRERFVGGFDRRENSGT